MTKRLLLLLLCLMLCLPALAQATPQPLADPADLPETNDEGFLPEGQDPVYYKDHTAGYWLYLDQTLRLEITRYQTKKPLLTYYLADIVLAEGSSLYTVTYNEEKPGRTNGLPQTMANRAGAVFAMSGDFYSYRVSKDRYPGHIVRDGKVLYSRSYTKKPKSFPMPNLATMALYPSGKAEVNEAWEVTAKEYVDRGASTVLAFGPILLKDFEMPDLDVNEYNHTEPRVCLGIVEPRHYAALLVEGRKDHSNGASLATCAQILYDYGCSDALNLDGGNTAAMLFMGESVMLANNGAVDKNDRAIPDILCAGTY